MSTENTARDPEFGTEWRFADGRFSFRDSESGDWIGTEPSPTAVRITANRVAMWARLMTPAVVAAGSDVDLRIATIERWLEDFERPRAQGGLGSRTVYRAVALSLAKEVPWLLATLRETRAQLATARESAVRDLASAFKKMLPAEEVDRLAKLVDPNAPLNDFLEFLRSRSVADDR